MRSELTISGPYRRVDGHIGARAAVAIEHPEGWHQTYTFDTHGMTSAQVAEKAAVIEEYHTRKAARLTGFRSIQGSEITALGGATYRVVDCTVLDRGVTLYLDVRPRCAGFPMRISYGDLDALPTDEGIVAMIAAALPASTGEIERAHDAFVAKVMEKRK